jgi:signal transduction histidine kinase
MRELEHKAKLEYALVNEREQLRQENSADFHDELGSKVTKISLFLTLAERSLKNKEDPSAWFNKIRFNIKDLSGGFRDLLWVIDPKKDSLSDTFLRLKDFGEELFETAQIDFRIKGFHINQDKLMLDPQTKKQIVMIFKEAMNNCVKYSECKHAILTISTTKQFSSVELTDDGKGFDLDKKSKGRGLKNMKNRANKINAELNIITNDKGTTIQLHRIPLMSDNFKAEDM